MNLICPVLANRRGRRELSWISPRRYGAKFCNFSVVSGAVIILVIIFSNMILAQQQQNPLTMNGGSILAMAGRNCVVLAVDKRFGSGRSLVHVRSRPVLHLPTSMVAFTGMEGDVQSLLIELNAQIIDKYYRGLGFGERSASRTGYGANVDVSVLSVAMLTSHILYRRKRAPYYVEPVVVGLEPDGWVDFAEEEANSKPTKGTIDGAIDDFSCIEGENDSPGWVQIQDKMKKIVLSTRRSRYRPYICCMDMIGAKSESNAFSCAGTASKSLYGTAEALWKPNLSPDALVSVCTKAFLSALERDCLSGYGAMLYLLTPDGITEYDISGRSD
jgi:20S proteasome subunit beta 3